MIETIIAGISAATSLYDMFNDDSDKAMADFLENVSSIAGEEKVQAAKYGDIAEEMRDPSSYYFQNIRGAFLDDVSTKSAESIRKLRAQGIYSPSMERLITQDFTLKGSDKFMTNVGEITKQASLYSGLEQDSFANYADTMASAYQSQFMGKLNEPTASESFGNLLSSFANVGEASETISSIFS